MTERKDETETQEQIDDSVGKRAESTAPSYSMENWTVPQTKKTKKRGVPFSYIWLVPLLATLGVCWLIFEAMLNRGQSITIEFSSAQGLQAGRTQVRYQGIEMGKVDSMTLSDDLKTIKVRIQMQPHATKMLREDTEFWLVQPKATITEISGLDTLISGNYITLSPGESPVSANYFIALRSPPAKVPTNITNDGLIFTLTSDQLDSVQVGAKLLYKKIEVGEILNYRIENNKILINAFVSSEYKNLVKKESRFWNMSGISAKIGFKGLEVNMANLPSLLQGGVAFDSPAESPVATDNTNFTLYSDASDAERTIPITVDIPLNSDILKEGTSILYQGVEIGHLRTVNFTEDRSKMIADGVILPEYSDLLTENATFLIEEPDLATMKNLTNLITGNYLTLETKPGKPADHFIAQTMTQQRENEPHSLKLTLTAENSLGLKAGSKVFYKGVVVGYITGLTLMEDQVIFGVVISEKYSSLVRSESSFFLDGGIQTEVSAQGINVNIPSVDQLLQSGVSFTSIGKEPARALYPLFESKMSAQLADKDATGTTDYQLVSDTMPSVSENSTILYKNMTVGHVTQFKMEKDKIYLTLAINNQYRTLINANTVFWSASGVRLNASTAGINFEMGPLTTLISGSIAFDTIKDIPNKTGDHWILYSSLQDAQKVGRRITFMTADSMGLSKGAKIKYNGIEVGEVNQLTPNFKTKKIKIDATLYTQYAKNLAFSSSRFWVVTSEIGLSGIRNADALLSPYIAVDVDSTVTRKSQSQFPLYSVANPQNGLQIVLEAKTGQSIGPGTPILYRELQVGEVTDVTLGSLSDRVLFHLNVKPDYAYLIRENTIFWNTSGVNIDVSLLKGASVKTGTADSILRGGIAFATPEPEDNHPLKPIATTGKRFFLNQEVKKKWLKWQTIIPK